MRETVHAVTRAWTERHSHSPKAGTNNTQPATHTHTHSANQVDGCICVCLLVNNSTQSKGACKRRGTRQASSETCMQPQPKRWKRLGSLVVVLLGL